MDYLALDDVLNGLFDYINNGKLNSHEFWDEKYPLYRNYALTIIGVEHVSIVVSKNNENDIRFEANLDTSSNPKFTGTFIISLSEETYELYFKLLTLWQAAKEMSLPFNNENQLELFIEKLMEQI